MEPQQVKEKAHAENYFEGFNTRAVHIGNEPDPQTHSVTVPIYLASTFEVVADAQKYVYARLGNPTRTALESNLASLEKAKFCVCASSGLAACCLIMHLFKPGESILCSDDVYPGVRKYMKDMASVAEGIQVDFADLSDLETVKKSVKPTTKAVWIESPGHVTAKIFDIAGIANICKERNILLIVDNSTLSPYLQNPLSLGASLVLHSCTNSICGHSDVLMGAIMLNDETLYPLLRKGSILMGSTPSAFDCYLVLRGVKTLGVRMDEAQANAMELAKLLSTHSKIEQCIYPGLSSHRGHEALKAQAKGFGAVMSIKLKGAIESAKKFCSRLRLFAKTTGAGGVESTVHIPAVSTYKETGEDVRKQLGVTENLITLSIGIEDVADLKQDLISALDQL